LAFVFNKGAWGVGYLAEGRRQRDAEEIAKIAGIAKIGNLKKGLLADVSARRSAHLPE
jgi:hypothetical protein